MIVICVMDDHGGMLFNHRRQSQDRILRARILQRTIFYQRRRNYNLI